MTRAALKNLYLIVREAKEDDARKAGLMMFESAVREFHRELGDHLESYQRGVNGYLFPMAETNESIVEDIKFDMEDIVELLGLSY